MRPLEFCLAAPKGLSSAPVDHLQREPRRSCGILANILRIFAYQLEAEGWKEGLSASNPRTLTVCSSKRQALEQNARPEIGMKSVGDRVQGSV
jgi:hypothetical protein